MAKSAHPNPAATLVVTKGIGFKPLRAASANGIASGVCGISPIGSCFIVGVFSVFTESVYIGAEFCRSCSFSIFPLPVNNHSILTSV